MAGSGEHVHGGGGLEFIAQGVEAENVPGQGGGVAGDVDDTLQRHGIYRPALFGMMVSQQASG